MINPKNTFRTTIIGIYFAFSLNVSAFDRDEFVKGVDTIFADIPIQNAPGCAVGIIQGGKFLHRAGYGKANLEHNISLTPDTIFRMASVSKQFTATAILLLAEDGLIDLDEDIRTYLPELPDYGAKVTIQSMLGHVSGMGDYDLIASGYEGEKIENGIDLKSVAGGPFRLGNEDYLTIEEFYNIVKRVKLKNRPMEKADYSNLAYFLFSMLIEEKSGLTLREFAEKNIFKPLGMSQTIYSDDVNEIIKNRASGYKKKETGDYKISMTNLAMVGDGGLHTSINDFIKWDNNFYSPVLGKQPSDFIKKLNTPNSNLTIGDALYANGQFVTQQLDRKVYSHSGGWLGFSTFYLRFPEHYFSIITLCNDEGSNPEKYSIEIAKLYFNLIGSR